MSKLTLILFANELEKFNEITEEVKSLKTALQSTQANAYDEEKKLKEDIEDLKEKLVKAERDLGSSLNERDKLTDLCQQHSRSSRVKLKKMLLIKQLRNKLSSNDYIGLYF